MFDLIVFDLDGTLADTSPDIAGALNHMLGELGRAQIPAPRVRQLIGDGAKALIRRALVETGGASDELVERGFQIYIDHYAANICNGTAAYPGVEQALDALDAQGIGVAICTNKPGRLTHLLLEALGWGKRFRIIVSGDTLPVRKPDPAPLLQAIAQAGGGRAAFVGDSMVDAETARAAGLPFVAVSFGFSDRPVKELGAAAVIDSYAELLPTLERLNGRAG